MHVGKSGQSTMMHSLCDELIRSSNSGIDAGDDIFGEYEKNIVLGSEEAPENVDFDRQQILKLLEMIAKSASYRRKATCIEPNNESSQWEAASMPPPRRFHRKR